MDLVDVCAASAALGRRPAHVLRVVGGQSCGGRPEPDDLGLGDGSGFDEGGGGAG